MPIPQLRTSEAVSRRSAHTAEALRQFAETLPDDDGASFCMSFGIIEPQPLAAICGSGSFGHLDLRARSHGQRGEV